MLSAVKWLRDALNAKSMDREDAAGLRMSGQLFVVEKGLLGSDIHDVELVSTKRYARWAAYRHFNHSVDFPVRGQANNLLTKVECEPVTSVLIDRCSVHNAVAMFRDIEKRATVFDRSRFEVKVENVNHSTLGVAEVHPRIFGIECDPVGADERETFGHGCHRSIGIMR